MSAIHADWIREIDLSVFVQAADHNGISIRIEAPRHIVRVRKPLRVYPVPGCAQATATSAILMDIDLAQIEVDKSSSIPSSDSRTINVWPNSEMNGKLDYAKLFWRLPRQPVKDRREAIDRG